MPTPPRLVPSIPYPTYIFIAGIQASGLARIASLTITDVINEQANTASLTVNLTPHGPLTPPFHPPAFDAGGFNTTPSPSSYPAIRRGQPIEIFSGGYSPDQCVFAGTIVTVRQVYEGSTPTLVAYQLSCTDHTRALNRRKVTKSYATQSVSTIVLDLMASRLVDGFSTAFVVPHLPAVAIDFTFEEMNRALTRLANRIGAYWYVDYQKQLHFFLDEPGDPPAPIVPGERFADLTFETDLSQVRTRVVVEGAGTIVTTQIGIGETVVPVRDPVMFPLAGGLAIVGQQRLSYTGVQVGDRGSLVGPGAQPGSAPVATPAIGSGIEVGTHGYAVTYTSASGESLPSPVAAVVLGRTDAPATAPTPQPPTSGTGPNPGVHQYGVSFVTAAGETTLSPLSAPVTTTQVGGVPAPAATSAALRNVSGNLAAGVSYAYKTTITTAGGETLPGPAWNTIRPAGPVAPTAVTSSGVATINQAGGGLIDGRSYTYLLAYLSGAYETGLSPALGVVAHSPIPPIPPNPSAGTVYGYIAAGGGSISTGTYWYGISWVYGSYESAVEIFPGSGFAVNNALGQTAVAMNMTTCPDARCTGIRIWRSRAGTPGTYYLNATLGNVTSYVDTLNDGSLGGARAHTNPIGTPAPVGIAMQFAGFVVSPDPKVTGQRLYRFRPDTNDYRVVTTLTGNTSVPFVDALADAALGASRGLNTGPIGTAPGDQATVTVPTSADPRAVGRKLYRSDNGAPYRYLTTVNNNSATQVIDNAASVSTNPDAPTIDTTGGALTCVVQVTDIPIGPGNVTARKLYRTPAGALSPLLCQTIANNTATTFTDTKTDAALTTAPPGTNSTIAQQTALSQIPIGGTGVTTRKLYRTKANVAPLQFLATLPNNTATTYTDAAADGTLGANVPTIDTSGLQQPQGQVNAGATTIPVSGTTAFSVTGGFAVVGNGEQVVRYTGVTVTALTGIPASGPGALTSTVPYNSSITVAPALTGIPASGPGAISARGLVDGEEIHLLIERNDLQAQAALAAIEGGDGVIEHYIQDRRLSAPGATATADAELELFAAPEIRVRYTTRDTKTRSGKPVVIDLPAPTNLVGTYVIQRVHFSRFDLPGIPPLRTVEASSTRFSFEDVLRRLELELDA